MFSHGFRCPCQSPVRARSMCRAARGRAGAPLPQHLPTGLVPLEAVPSPWETAGSGALKPSGSGASPVPSSPRNTKYGPEQPGRGPGAARQPFCHANPLQGFLAVAQHIALLWETLPPARAELPSGSEDGRRAMLRVLSGQSGRSRWRGNSCLCPSSQESSQGLSQN